MASNHLKNALRAELKRIENRIAKHTASILKEKEEWTRIIGLFATAHDEPQAQAELLTWAEATLESMATEAATEALTEMAQEAVHNEQA